MTAEADDYLAVLKASYDYEPQSEDEIAIKENQILFLKERVDDEYVCRSDTLPSYSHSVAPSWWKVKVRGETQDEDSPVGLVPAAYVEQVSSTVLCNPTTTSDIGPTGGSQFNREGTLRL